MASDKLIYTTATPEQREEVVYALKKLIEKLDDLPFRITTLESFWEYEDVEGTLTGERQLKAASVRVEW